MDKKKKQDLYVYCLQETYLTVDRRPIERYTLIKSKGVEKIFHANAKEKKSWGSSTYIRQNRL